jgi:hypothetical protein
LLSIGTLTISDETISLLNVGVSNIKINGKSEPEQELSHQGATKVVTSTIKTK